MPRVRLSEFTAKQLLFPRQPVFSASSRTTSRQLAAKFAARSLVVKLDQGVKRRGQRGLVAVNLRAAQVITHLHRWSRQGWVQFLVEPYLSHSSHEENYLSLERVRSGWQLIYSPQGGVEIESHWDSAQTIIINPLNPALAQLDFLPPAIAAQLLRLLSRLQALHLLFLELNPVLFRRGKLVALDAACEFDNAALSLASLAPYHLAAVTPHLPVRSETQVAALDATTPASLKFRLLNPQGRIWMLLSGGGASLVLADEVADLGLGSELANYGEYSGAPTSDDTYAYTKIVLQQLLKSRHSDPRALVIAGGVANFTDVAVTFHGIIRALTEFHSALVKSRLKVFVRRGGPNEELGLQAMRNFLLSHNLLGSVHGRSAPLPRVIKEVSQYLGRS